MKLNAINKFYKDKAALSDVTLEIEEGKITAVLGESGAGKTTLLNVIAGTVRYEGTVEGVGAISYLYQSPKLLPHLTLEGNLRFVLPKGLRADAKDILEKVGLGGREKAFPRELSGGEKQRVAIARAFLYPHDVLLMDEPFSSLDLSLKKGMLELTERLWREKKSTVVFVTHDVREAVTLAHRAVVLREGKLVESVEIAGEPPRDFLSAPPEEAPLIHALLREN